MINPNSTNTDPVLIALDSRLWDDHKEKLFKPQNMLLILAIKTCARRGVNLDEILENPKSCFIKDRLKDLKIWYEMLPPTAKVQFRQARPMMWELSPAIKTIAQMYPPFPFSSISVAFQHL